jgi:ferredoxin-NADP reductase
VTVAPWRIARVLATRPETPRVRTIVLDVDDWPGHRAGQHVDVRLTADDGYQAQRSYSIASAPGAPNVELTVEMLDDGEVSSHLGGELRAGDLLEVRGPIGGHFVWEPRLRSPLALVAGGSGVVPLMSMLRARARSGSDVPTRLLYSARALAEVIYREELDAMAAADPTLSVTYTLTRERPADWTGFARRTDEAMLDAVIPPPADAPLVYVCGPTSMVELVAYLLVERGHVPSRVRTERFGPTAAA